MRVVMIFILLCIKLGFPKFFKFYEFLKNRFHPFRRHRQRKSKTTFFHSNMLLVYLIKVLTFFLNIFLFSVLLVVAIPMCFLIILYFLYQVLRLHLGF
ncbi:hypothetical protein TrVFT333_007572 [Trichoderma virens FT-333]|nr:hypothetical protein TrVFT333_007572 [Trichoderma virens FT-333]